MGLGDYAEKLRGVYDELTGADGRDTELAIGFGPDYDAALDDANDRLPEDGEVETVDDYEGGSLDLTDVDADLDEELLTDLGGEQLTVAVLEYEVTEEPEPETTTRSRGAGAAGDRVDDSPNALNRLDYDQ